MILDKKLFKNINIIGEDILKEIGLNEPPKNIEEMEQFLLQIKKHADDNTFKGALISDIFFSFVTSMDIRNRSTTSRIFEDIFSALFNKKSTDSDRRVNPPITEEIRQYDHFCEDEDWSISTDLSSNKREKTDLTIDEYNISLKTLKGKAYDEKGIILDKDINTELNVGSLSFRALMKGILDEDKLKQLGDRKKGLGSGKQLRNNIFNHINENDKNEAFLDRLNVFLSYIYEDDVYIVLKSHYRIEFILIKNEDFINCLVTLYDKEEENFQNVFYRWENNNLRLNWVKMLKYMDNFDLEYKQIPIDLSCRNNNKDLNDFKNSLNTIIKNKLEGYLK